MNNGTSLKREIEVLKVVIRDSELYKPLENTTPVNIIQRPPQLQLSLLPSSFISLVSTEVSEKYSHTAEPQDPSSLVPRPNGTQLRVDYILR